MAEPVEAQPAEPTSGRWRSSGLVGSIAGASGVAMALAFGEFVDDLSEPVPSLVIAVGEAVTDYTPGDVVAFSIANVGASQKTLLTAGIVILMFLVGARLGRSAAGGRRDVAVVGFAAFGLLGGWAAARNPLSPALSSWAVALAAAALAAATTLFLVSRASAASQPPAARKADNADKDNGDENDENAAAADRTAEGDLDEGRRMLARGGPRRSFFGYSAGAAVAALGLLGLGRSLREPSAAQRARQIYTLPPRPPARTPEASAGAAGAPAGTGVQVPEGIEIPGGVELPEGVAIPEGVEIPESVAIPENAEALEGVEAPDTEVPDASVPDAQQPAVAEEEPTAVAASPQPPDDSPATATTTARASEESGAPAVQAPEEPPPTTTQAQQEPPPTTTTAPAPDEPPATTTSAPASEEPPATTTSTTTTTTTAPQSRSSLHPQVSHLDTLDEVPGIAPYVTPITPTNEFYRIDTALTVPQVDPDRWRLRITGLVDNPYELTYQEIRAMSLSDHVITLSCVSNEVGGDLVGNAIWTGVPLNVLLQRAGVQRGAQQIVGRSVDHFTAGFPTTTAYDGRNAILAIGMNNEPLPLRHGFPARIVVAGLYGYVSAVKWLEEIHLTTWDGFDGYWVPRGWSKQGPVKTQSRIDVPADGSTLAAGETVAIAGVAWAPTRGIRQVEVRIGDEAWAPCSLGEAAGDESWVQWYLPWTPEAGGRRRIQVRATDGNGSTQSSNNVRPRPNGAEGWHTIRVNVRA